MKTDELVTSPFFIYNRSAVIYAVNQPATPNIPISENSNLHYTIIPSLPEGLLFDKQSGCISGTPTLISHPVVYTITGSDGNIKSTARLQIEVKEESQSIDIVDYLREKITYTLGYPIAPNIPIVAGGDITQFEITPMLPSGLHFDTSSGVISGMPSTESSTTTYSVTAVNAVQNTVFSLIIDVTSSANPLPETFFYLESLSLYSVGQPININYPSAGGAPGGDIVSYTISPALPNGLNMSAITGIISGTPMNVQPLTSYIITAKNKDAQTLSFHLRIAVVNSNKWLPAGSMKYRRFMFEATKLENGNIIVTGGSYRDWSDPTYFYSECELYDFRKGIWIDLPDMFMKRVMHCSTLLNDGKVLITGGSTNNMDSLSSVEMFDPFKLSWLQMSSMKVPRSSHQATLLNNGQVLVTGGLSGYTERTSTILASVELYDPESNIWKQVADMNTPRSGHTAVLLDDGRVMVLGNLQVDYSTEIYDPLIDKWTFTDNTHNINTDYRAVKLEDNSILAMGGILDVFDRSVYAERYDPIKNNWTVLAPLNTGRDNHCATLLADGKVIVTGGSDNPSAEIYDIATNSWTLTAGMNIAREYHKTLLLNDGTVLVIGGEMFNEGNNNVSSAEIWHAD